MNSADEKNTGRVGRFLRPIVGALPKETSADLPCPFYICTHAGIAEPRVLVRANDAMTRELRVPLSTFQLNATRVETLSSERPVLPLQANATLTKAMAMRASVHLLCRPDATGAFTPVRDPPGGLCHPIEGARVRACLATLDQWRRRKDAIDAKKDLVDKIQESLKNTRDLLVALEDRSDFPAMNDRLDYARRLVHVTDRVVTAYTHGIGDVGDITPCRYSDEKKGWHPSPGDNSDWFVASRAKIFDARDVYLMIHALEHCTPEAVAREEDTARALVLLARHAEFGSLPCDVHPSRAQMTAYLQRHGVLPADFSPWSSMRAKPFLRAMVNAVRLRLHAESGQGLLRSPAAVDEPEFSAPLSEDDAWWSSSDEDEPSLCTINRGQSDSSADSGTP